jgi:hypothetical protein
LVTPGAVAVSVVSTFHTNWDRHFLPSRWSISSTFIKSYTNPFSSADTYSTFRCLHYPVFKLHKTYLFTAKSTMPKSATSKSTAKRTSACYLPATMNEDNGILVTPVITIKPEDISPFTPERHRPQPPGPSFLLLVMKEPVDRPKAAKPYVYGNPTTPYIIGHIADNKPVDASQLPVVAGS